MGLFSKLFGRKKKDEDFLSIVYLMRKPFPIEDGKLASVLAKFAQRIFKMPEPPQAHVNQMSENAFGIAVEGQPFVVMSVAQPYTEADPEQITPDLRKQNLLKAHKAWLACDWMMDIGDDADHRKLAYRTMGMIMAIVAKAGADKDAIAVFDKATGRLVPFDASVVERLAGEFPESVFEENVPILSGEGLEAELEKAAAEAQERIPEFIQAFQKRSPVKRVSYAVKAKFVEGESVEWMWVSVQRLTDEGFEGRLDNDPEQIKRLKAGDRVAVPLDEVVDWAIADDSGMKGGFSVAVFQRHAGAGG